MTTPGTITESGIEPPRNGLMSAVPLRRLHGVLDRYRVTLAALTLLLLVVGSDYVPYGHHNPPLALSAATIWLLFGAFRPLLIHQPPLSLQIGLDIVLVTLLIHASGGVSSGLGMLLILPLALAGILLPARIAALLAALAALALLGEELHAHLGSRFTPNYFQAGLSGAIYFATVLLSVALAQRLRENERHIEEQNCELADLARLNNHIIEQMETGIIVADGEGRLHRMNRAAAKALRIDPQNVPGSLAEVSPELARVAEQWLTHGPGREPATIHGGRLTLRLVPLKTGRSGSIILHIEESAALVQQAQQMKLASLGRLTASIAHEIRNPIGAISHAAQLLGESSRLEETERRLATIIHHQTERVNTIVENVLQLGRGQPADIRPFRLKPWLEEVAAELRQTTTNDSPVAIHVEVEPASLVIHFDPEHLRQIVWNLYRNARDAAGDRLVFRLRGGYASDATPCLRVCDNGPGVDPELEGQIFEPFFTTGSKRTGLGLYIVRELCSANQARINLLPRPEGGACFHIEFADSHGET